MCVPLARGYVRSAAVRACLGTSYVLRANAAAPGALALGTCVASV